MGESQKLVHRGYHYDRTQIDDPQGKIEKAAADYWEKGTDFCSQPVSYAELLRAKISGNPFTGSFGQKVEVPDAPLTQAEATMAATVFQWMFTSIGRSALYEVCKAAGWSVRMEPLKSEQKLDHSK
jgi:hypothetical protein